MAKDKTPKSKKKVTMGFKKLVTKLMKDGHTEESAKRIAASIGRKKFGKRRFNNMAQAGKRKNRN